MWSYCFSVRYIMDTTKDKEKGEISHVVADSFEQAMEWVRGLVGFRELIEVLCVCQIRELITNKDNKFVNFRVSSTK